MKNIENVKQNEMSGKDLEDWFMEHGFSVELSEYVVEYVVTTDAVRELFRTYALVPRDQPATQLYDHGGMPVTVPEKMDMKEGDSPVYMSGWNDCIEEMVSGTKKGASGWTVLQCETTQWTVSHKGHLRQPETMLPLLITLTDGSIKAAICLRDDPADEHIRYATVSHENANLSSLDVYDQSNVTEQDVVKWRYIDV